MSAAALRRMPQDVLDEALDSMDVAARHPAAPAARRRPAPPRAVGRVSHATQIFWRPRCTARPRWPPRWTPSCFRPADRRILLISNNAADAGDGPGAGRDARLRAAARPLRRGALLERDHRPLHPGGWSPRPDDVPLWERHLRRLWNLGDDEVELAVESIQVHPALGLRPDLHRARPSTVYADGLMSYGPTRDKLDPLVGTRIGRLLHLDLVPGLKPLLLTEFGVAAGDRADGGLR